MGKHWEQWASLAEQLGVRGRVLFPGFRRDVREMLAQLDVYLLPSRPEAGGTSELEAMAMERAVVASDVGGIAESATPETGVSIPARGLAVFQRGTSRAHAQESAVSGGTQYNCLGGDLFRGVTLIGVWPQMSRR